MMWQGVQEMDQEAAAGDTTDGSGPAFSPSPQTRQQTVASGDVASKPRSGSPRSPTAASKPSQLWTTDIPDGLSSVNASDPLSSSSATADKQLGQGLTGHGDRVFPIRSVVSVDPSQTPFLAPGRTSGEHDAFPGMVVPGVSGVSGQDITQSDPSQKFRASSIPVPSAKISASESRKASDASTSSMGFGVSTDRKISALEAHRRRSSSKNRNEKDGIYGGGARMQLFSDSTSDKSTDRGTDKSGPAASYQGSLLTNPNSGGIRTPAEQDSAGNLVTARFKHIVTQEGHAVITGRDGDILQRCEDEPIHIPGAVQSFGLLIALKEESEGQLAVRIVSENSKRIIGYSPQDLFKLSSFTDILSEEQADNLLDHVDFIRDEDADPATNGPEVFTISIRYQRKKAVKLWCAMHINPVAPDIIICEFELDDDQLHPLVPLSEESPELPEDTLNSNPTQEELAESTLNKSKPLRVLRSARKRKGEAAAMEVFNIMSQVQEQLASAPNLETFLKILVGVVKELTGFHRVMIYQFDSSFNGRVVTELVDPRATKDLYKGLNFPASDIPKQARDMYKINKVRLLYDRDLETARLVCRTVEELDSPLDLSFSYLRAMSPIHIKYLSNMAVRASMSISINAFNELWGLIACHAYGSKGMRVSFPIRKMCRLIGDTASRNIERLSYASRLQARKLINTVPTETNPSGYIIASSDDLLTLFDADFGLLSIHGETKILGKLEHSQEALVMLEYLRLRNITSVITSQDVKEDFPDLRYGPGFAVIAGLLLVPLSVGGNDFIVFFRKGQIKEVKWAGNPYEKFIKEGTEGYLEPRKSFKTWSETVVGKCREWTEEQVETAAVLCLVYGKFIEVWRQKEAALQSSQLTKLLLANQAHEVRTPLNAIINYLEIALEGTLDQETRDNLAKSHSASKSLIYVINDLLDLTKTEEGQDLIKDEVFDLSATIREATDNFKGDAKRKGIEYHVIENGGIPQYVQGDQRRVRQAVSNITANAMQHTTTGWVRVELWLAEQEGRRVAIDIVVEDTGCGMSNQKLDALFRDLEQVSTDESSDVFSPQEENDNQNSSGNGPQSRTLGLGLAIVARIVRNMDGQLRLKSEVGEGSRFVIQLPFYVPENVPKNAEGSTAPPSLSSAHEHSMPSSLRNLSVSEVMLVDNASSHKESVIRKRSVEDINSIQSYKSGSSGRSGRSGKSDVDRLIDAISEPLAVGRPESEETRIARSNSKGSGTSRKTAGSVGNTSVQSGTRAGKLTRSKSYNAESTPEHLRSSAAGPAGSEFVVDNKTLLKAIRMPDEFQETPETEAHPQTASRVLFDIPSRQKEEPRQQTADHLQVLVAEDDPVNSKIIKKRMEKAGHEVYHTVNGEECATAYCEKSAFFDVILMDMQMPIVDGLTSTKMIRSYEKTHEESDLSPRAKANGRVPILAVSASLVERERQAYIDAGFDGWILKPIDFKRLNTLLTGIVDEKVRIECLYQPGEWERGGFFDRRQESAYKVNTRPSDKSPIEDSPQDNEPEPPEKDSISSGHSTSSADTIKSHQKPVLEPRRPLIHDERLDATEQIAGNPGQPAEDRTFADVSDQPDA